MATARAPRASGQAGSAMLLAVIILLLVVSIGLTSSQVATTEIELAGNYAQSWRAFYAADGAAQASFNDLIAVARQVGTHPEVDDLASLSHRTVDGIDFSLFEMLPDGEAVEGSLPSGFYQGLVAFTRPYRVTLTAETDTFPAASASVTMGMDFDIIPIFQFAVFYEYDLEMLPGPTMTLSGRVHSNGDMYLGANETLTIDSNVTSAGDLFNRRKDDNSQPGGSVRIRDGLGAFPAMAGLDSADSGWVDESLERWRGNVRTAAHGVERLNLTISDPSNPHLIIEPGYDSDTAADRASKIFYAAEMNINILNGQGFDPDGNPIDLGQAIDFDVLFDQREAKDMLVVEIDLERLATVTEFPDPGVPATVYIGSFEPGNGIPEWEVVDWNADGSGGGGGGGGGGSGGDGDSGSSVEDFLNSLLGGCSLGVCTQVTVALTNIATAKSTCTLLGPLGSGTASGLMDIVLAALETAAALDLGFEPEWVDLMAPAVEELAECNVDGFEEPIPGLEIPVPVETVTWPAAWTGYDPPYEGGDTEFAIKIVNGSQLFNPLTIVTANPAYIQGDYNTIDKQPAAVLADAVTILSNAWSADDNTHSRLPLASRVATNTAMNVALMLGNTETTPGSYNGGVENLPRFLESWSGRTFTYRGSLIDLWYSRNATGDWIYGSPIYTAPVRDWEFDTDLSDPQKLPPATPRVYTLRVSQWRRH